MSDKSTIRFITSQLAPGLSQERVISILSGETRLRRVVCEQYLREIDDEARHPLAPGRIRARAMIEAGFFGERA